MRARGTARWPVVVHCHRPQSGPVKWASLASMRRIRLGKHCPQNSKTLAEEATFLTSRPSLLLGGLLLSTPQAFGFVALARLTCSQPDSGSYAWRAEVRCRGDAVGVFFRRGSVFAHLPPRRPSGFVNRWQEGPCHACGAAQTRHRPARMRPGYVGRAWRCATDRCENGSRMGCGALVRPPPTLYHTLAALCMSLVFTFRVGVRMRCVQRGDGTAMVLVVVALARVGGRVRACVVFGEWCVAPFARARLSCVALLVAVCCVAPLVALLFHLCAVVAWLLRSLEEGGRRCVWCSGRVDSAVLLRVPRSSSLSFLSPLFRCRLLVWRALCRVVCGVVGAVRRGE